MNRMCDDVCCTMMNGVRRKNMNNIARTENTSIHARATHAPSIAHTRVLSLSSLNLASDLAHVQT